MTKRHASHLARLKDLRSLHIAAESPDVRGWLLVGKDGSRLGRVEDLLVDRRRKTAPYLIVHVEVLETGASERRDVLVPTNSIRVDRRNEQLVAEITADEIVLFPRYPVDRSDAVG
jgi:sporulation protein YlmC with PRC-barrel domain